MDIKTLNNIEVECQKEQHLANLSDVELEASRLRLEALKWTELGNLRNLVREFKHTTGPWVSAIHVEGDNWSNIEFGNWLIRKMNNLEIKDEDASEVKDVA